MFTEIAKHPHLDSEAFQEEYEEFMDSIAKSNLEFQQADEANVPAAKLDIVQLEKEWDWDLDAFDNTEGQFDMFFVGLELTAAAV